MHLQSSLSTYTLVHAHTHTHTHTTRLCHGTLIAKLLDNCMANKEGSPWKQIHSGMSFPLAIACTFESVPLVHDTFLLNFQWFIYLFTYILAICLLIKLKAIIRANGSQVQMKAPKRQTFVCWIIDVSDKCKLTMAAVGRWDAYFSQVNGGGQLRCRHTQFSLPSFFFHQNKPVNFL